MTRATLQWNPRDMSAIAMATRRAVRRTFARIHRQQVRREITELGYVDLGGEA